MANGGGPGMPSIPVQREVDIRSMPSVPPDATVGMATYKFVSTLPQLAQIFVCGAIAWLLLEKGGDHAVHALIVMLGPVIADRLYKSKPTGVE